MTVQRRAALRWGLTAIGSTAFQESRSAATVTHVETAAGARAYLKVTGAAAGAGALAAARRELAFYSVVAPVVPGVAPRLLDAHDDEDGVALLVEDVGQVLPPSSWDTARWRSLAVTIRRVHDVRVVPDRPEFGHATGLEDAIARRSPEVEQFWAGLVPALGDVLAMLGRALPRHLTRDVFTHGDLHLDNVISAPAGHATRIVDWQQCGLGSAAGDLAFINVRLAPSAQVAPEAFLEAYAAHGGDDLAALRRATTVLELATYIHMWPPFAAYNAPDGISAVRARAAELAGIAMADPEIA